MNKDGDARLFTYNFGNEATDDMLKKAACQNNGVYQKIPDGGNLKLAMASYVNRLYKLIGYIGSPTEATSSWRWRRT